MDAPSAKRTSTNANGPKSVAAIRINRKMLPRSRRVPSAPAGLAMQRPSFPLFSHFHSARHDTKNSRAWHCEDDCRRPAVAELALNLRRDCVPGKPRRPASCDARRRRAPRSAAEPRMAESHRVEDSTAASGLARKWGRTPDRARPPAGAHRAKEGVRLLARRPAG